MQTLRNVVSVTPCSSQLCDHCSQGYIHFMHLTVVECRLCVFVAERALGVNMEVADSLRVLVYSRVHGITSQKMVQGLLYIVIPVVGGFT
jgi:hypothetical protein